MFRIRPLISDSSSPEVFQLVNVWLKGCVKSHKECNRTPDGTRLRLPGRLIDVGSDTQDPFLFQSEESSAPYGSWVALSHCWGKK